MKKLLIVLFALLLLAGCSQSSHYSFLSDGDDVLFKGPKASYTKNDLYKSLKVSGEDGIKQDILDHIALKLDGIDMDALYADADELIENYKSMGYDYYIVSQFGSIDAYRKYYVSTLLVSELAKVYVNENFEELSKDKKPVKMQVASFKTLEDAQKCIEDVNNASTFDMAAVNNNADYAPASTVYTDDDASLALEIKEYLNSTDTLGLSSIITSASSDSSSENAETYYVLNVESRNIEDFKDDFIALLAASESSEDVTKYFLTTHKVEFFDQDLYELMSAAYEELR